MTNHYEGRKHEPKDNDRPGYTGTRYEPAGVVHRGEYFTPDGEGGMVHAYADNNELIYHYSGERRPLRYEGTDIGYAIVLEGGRGANITITSERHRNAIIDGRVFAKGEMSPNKKEEK